jgi:hypothetical protein
MVCIWYKNWVALKGINNKGVLWCHSKPIVVYWRLVLWVTCLWLALTFKLKKMEDYVGPAWFPSELALPSLPGQAKPCQPGRANLARSPQQGKTCQCRTRGKLNEKPNALLALTSSSARWNSTWQRFQACLLYESWLLQCLLKIHLNLVELSVIYLWLVLTETK